MLKGTNPLLIADVFYTLCCMGHGDDQTIVDKNFPPDSVARQTHPGQLPGVDALDEIPPVQRKVQTVIDVSGGNSWPVVSIERFAFYERAKKPCCVIQTSERRFYGCLAFRKGVIPPDEAWNKVAQ